MDKVIVVSVLVLSFNQERTIARTLDSIIGQKTSYSFEILIGDDCSQDGTRTICEQYSKNRSNIILLDKLPNMGVVKNYFRTLRRSRGKYIMGCAGDDWWHNPNKIQLQVDFMENHPSCCLCYGGVMYYNTITGDSVAKYLSSSSLSLKELLVYNPVAALTICYTRTVFDDEAIDEIISNNFCMEDYPLLLIAASKGDVCGINEILATYNVTYDSVSNCSTIDKKEHFEKQVLRVRSYYAKKFGLYNELDAFFINSYYLSLSTNGIRYNNRNYCRENLLKMRSKRLNDYVKLLLCFIPYGFSLLRIIYRDLIVK